MGRVLLVKNRLALLTSTRLITADNDEDHDQRIGFTIRWPSHPAAGVTVGQDVGSPDTTEYRRFMGVIFLHLPDLVRQLL
ncbi:hypothetical protein C3Y87_04095 [Carbonactinospora thermoautotrophica]|uniref:Uncharacterized protein n=1 Tax=Carbonactinospora thermoautotrophica TaxID=1469144 RepID=A0A132N193_9ACTN|nr:hypothetical protein [Carbonactinospora thermoautotrophica]KWX03817.1 hypothetical protein TH66_13660 [Carbonactinospora thermoautotrophica]KWX08490.1 hypothetical protein TR74_14755 [Carbonactinospora thermoautotrophica]MCX9190606.1 hypothetical protein [Carbonactinospora thermoautotrophica]